MKTWLTIMLLLAAILVRWECPAPGCATEDLAGFKLALFAKSPGGTWQKRVGVALRDPARREYLSPDMGAFLHAGDLYRVYVQSGDLRGNLSAPAMSPTQVWE